MLDVVVIIVGASYFIVPSRLIIIIINYATKILNTETDSKCRLCQQFDEIIDHIISACPILAKEHYIKRYDSVCAQLHFNICKEYKYKYPA